MASTRLARKRRGVLGRAALFSAVLIVGVLGLGVCSAFARTFNASLVISDSNMRAYDSMSAAQIQSFLNARTGPLKRMSFARHDGGSIAPASVIIWEAAQAWHINPKVLLTMLQKEQSLLTRKSLASQTLNRAVGAGCPDSGGNRYPGFGNQVWNGARMLDGYGEGGKTTDYVPHPWTPGLANGYTRWVHTSNLATYKLYVYNPSVGARAPYGSLAGRSCSGNANFWLIYWKYFGNPMSVRSAAALPAGVSATTIQLSSQFAQTRFDTATVLSGKLVSGVASISVAGASVHLDGPSGSGWVNLPATEQTVGADGKFSFSLRSDRVKRVRVAFSGTGTLGTAVSGCFVAEAIPVVSQPTAGASPVSTRLNAITGSIAPGHASTIQVSLQRKVRGIWRLWKTVTVRTGAAGGWRLNTRLSKPGEWRMRAIHQDSRHALGVSAWGYATVR